MGLTWKRVSGWRVVHFYSWHNIQNIHIYLTCFKFNNRWNFDPSGFTGLCLVWLPWGDLAIALMLSRQFCIVNKHLPEPCCCFCKKKKRKKPPDSPPLLAFNCSAIVLLSWLACGYRACTRTVSKKGICRGPFSPGPYATVHVSVGDSIYPPYLFNNPMKELWVPNSKKCDSQNTASVCH